MRILYLFLKITLKYYTLKVFYPRQKHLNSPREFLGRTIYVSNHAASFMDPLVVAGIRQPIVFFMTRSDVFTTFSKPFLWAAHMLPIYRQQDGQDTKSKNNEVFKTCTRILSWGRNLLIFGEGFTDDVFIRSLKPVKKGAVRIGFTSLEEINWSKKIYIAAVGCNYSDPNQMRSDILISTSYKICLNDYKEAYLENSNKVINDLTKKIELLMQEQITYVKNKKRAPLHEQIMIITRKGMNALSFDPAISLEDRWNYSRKLALWFNENEANNDDLDHLEEKADAYFKNLKKKKVEDHLLFWKMQSTDNSRLPEFMKLIALFPFALIGFIQCAIPYLITKKFVEKTMKRKVFWGSVKLIVGQLLIAIFNIPFLFIIYYFIYPSWLLVLAYFFSIGLTGLAAYTWMTTYRTYKKKGKLIKQDLGKLITERKALEQEIHRVIPSSFH